MAVFEIKHPLVQHKLGTVAGARYLNERFSRVGL